MGKASMIVGELEEAALAAPAARGAPAPAADGTALLLVALLLAGDAVRAAWALAAGRAGDRAALCGVAGDLAAAGTPAEAAGDLALHLAAGAPRSAPLAGLCSALPSTCEGAGGGVKLAADAEPFPLPLIPSETTGGVTQSSATSCCGGGCSFAALLKSKPGGSVSVWRQVTTGQMGK